MNKRVNGGPGASLLPTVALLDGWGGQEFSGLPQILVKQPIVGRREKDPFPLPHALPTRTSLLPVCDDEHVMDKGAGRPQPEAGRGTVSIPASRAITVGVPRGRATAHPAPTLTVVLAVWESFPRGPAQERIASSLQALPLSPQHRLDFLRGLLCFKTKGDVPTKISDALCRMERLSKAINLLGT